MWAAAMVWTGTGMRGIIPSFAEPWYWRHSFFVYGEIQTMGRALSKGKVIAK